MVNAPTGAPSRVHTATLYAGAGLLALVIAGTVALALAGWDAQRITGLWATAAAGAGVFLPILNKILNVNEAQTATLATIAHNTNGVLSDRIATGARAEIQAAIPAIADAVAVKIRAAWDEPIGYEPAPSSSPVEQQPWDYPPEVGRPGFRDPLDEVA